MELYMQGKNDKFIYLQQILKKLVINVGFVNEIIENKLLKNNPNIKIKFFDLHSGGTGEAYLIAKDH